MQVYFDKDVEVLKIALKSTLIQKESSRLLPTWHLTFDHALFISLLKIKSSYLLLFKDQVKQCIWEDAFIVRCCLIYH